MKSNLITFTNISLNQDIPKPVPASSIVPDWYKEHESYLGNIKKPDGQGGTTGTIKRCMPVFDAITSGYIIFTSADVFVTNVDGQSYFEWSSMSMVGFHSVEQALNHPVRNVPNNYPKFINHWGIKTPKGYSTLFIEPMHRESVFTIMPGVVDTDKYYAPVNFPFVLKDPKFEGLIPQGTPIAQVIPFKRESYKMKLGNAQDIKDIERVQEHLKLKLFDKYKNLFRTKKEYK